MLGYFFKRLLLFIPSLWILSILFFFLSKASPGDPALNRLESSLLGNGSSIENELKSLSKLRHQLGLDLPNFYFSIHRKTKSDTLYKIPNPQLRQQLTDLAFESGSWPLVNNYYNSWKQASSSVGLKNEELSLLKKIIQNNSLNSIQKSINTANNIQFPSIQVAVEKLKKNNTWWNNYILEFSWYGTTNQYHQWLLGIMKGQLGESYSDGNAVGDKISRALKTTSLITLISIFLAFSIAIPLAIKAAANQASIFDKTVSTLLYAFYALPIFWVATLLIIYFGGGDYLNWFPSYGLGRISEESTFLEGLQIRLAHLVLPIFCLTYGALAVIYKQLRNAMIHELSSDYIKTAKAKGLKKSQVLYKHAFKNASFPLITLGGKALPATVSGAFVIEFIFSINGMGKLTLDAFLARDYPVIFGILMLASFVTILGVWLADLCYHILDPRISIKSIQN